MVKEPGIIIVISAPSGAGKTSICREFFKTCPNVRYSVSFTTRPPRTGEKDGEDYSFISREEFRKKIEAQDFVEWTEKFGYLYGTSKGAVQASLEKGSDILLDIDTVGAKNIKNAFPEGVFVFILPPSMAELKRRLLGRGSETQADLKNRFDKAVDEIREAIWYDYAIVNEDINRAAEQFKAVYIAEKLKRSRIKYDIQREFNLEE